MGRTNLTPIKQPDDISCGPASLKLALAILGKRKGLGALKELCKTNRNGTSTLNMISAANKLGCSVLVVEYATLRHLQSALKYRPSQPRAAIVSYLEEDDENDEPHPESGHWAVVSSYMSDKSRIVLLDSGSGQKKSYSWLEFRDRWIDYDLKRKKLQKHGRQFQLVRRWQPQLLLIIARDPSDFPKFTIPTQKIFTPTDN